MTQNQIGTLSSNQGPFSVSTDTTWTSILAVFPEGAAVRRRNLLGLLP
jgi:hypothetical protein